MANDAHAMLVVGMDTKGVDVATRKVVTEFDAMRTKVLRTWDQMDARAEQSSKRMAAVSRGYDRAAVERMMPAGPSGGGYGVGASNKYRVGQIGMQLQDIGVQMQMGAKATTIILQQGTQIASLFGVRGAIYAGIGAMLIVYYDWISGEKQLAKQMEEGNALAKQRYDVVKAIKDTEEETEDILSGKDKQEQAIERGFQRKMHASDDIGVLPGKAGDDARKLIDKSQQAAVAWKDAKMAELETQRAHERWEKEGKEVDKIVKDKKAADLQAGRALDEHMHDLGEEFKKDQKYAQGVAKAGNEIAKAFEDAAQSARDLHQQSMDNLVGAQKDLKEHQAAYGDELHSRTFGHSDKDVRMQLRAEEHQKKAEARWEKRMNDTGGLIDVERDPLTGKVSRGTDPITGKRMSGDEARRRFREANAARKDRNKINAEISDENINKIVKQIKDLMAL